MKFYLGLIFLAAVFILLAIGACNIGDALLR